jgi:hypothetical protein
MRFVIREADGSETSHDLHDDSWRLLVRAVDRWRP